MLRDLEYLKKNQYDRVVFLHVVVRVFECWRLSFYKMSSKCLSKECSLCHSKFLRGRHRHPDGWSPSVIEFFKDASGFNSDVGNIHVCVCEACHLSIRKAMKCKDKGEQYQLRWLKSKKVSKCCVPPCKSVDIKAERHEFTWEVICDSIGIASVESPGDISLCTKHYQQVYRMLNEKSNACTTCGVLRRNCNSNFFCCPDPKRIEPFLREVVSVNVSVVNSDQVCPSCYKFFKRMLASDVCMLSSEDIVSELQAKKKQLERIVDEFEYVTLEPSDIVQWCLYKTALHVCELVVSDRPFLFPNMYRLFMQYVSDHDIELSSVCVSKSRLLTFLGNEFGELVTSFCTNKSIEIVFHRTKADMQSLLSHALQPNNCTASSQAYHTNFLNSQVHKLVNHQKSQSDDQSMKLAFDVEKYVDTLKSIAPEMWEHVCNLTMSVNERKGRSASVKGSALTGSIKTLRRAYLVSLILFVTM